MPDEDERRNFLDGRPESWWWLNYQQLTSRLAIVETQVKNITDRFDELEDRITGKFTEAETRQREHHAQNRADLRDVRDQQQKGLDKLGYRIYTAIVTVVGGIAVQVVLHFLWK